MFAESRSSFKDENELLAMRIPKATRKVFFVEARIDCAYEDLISIWVLTAEGHSNCRLPSELFACRVFCRAVSGFLPSISRGL
jgi:hypothetical protein